MHQYASNAKSDQKEHCQDRRHRQHASRYPHPEYNKHHRDNRKRHKHLETVHHKFREQQNIFGQIDPCDNPPVRTHHLHAPRYPSGEKAPHSNSDKNKNREILFRCIEHDAKHNRINQHHAERLNQPPHPVQKRIGHFRLQISLRGADSVGEIFFHVSKEPGRILPDLRHGNASVQKTTHRPGQAHADHRTAYHVFDSE